MIVFRRLYFCTGNGSVTAVQMFELLRSLAPGHVVVFIMHLQEEPNRSTLDTWSGRAPGEGHGHPLQYSCLENSVDRGTWCATVQGVTEWDMTELSTVPRTYMTKLTIKNWTVYTEVSCHITFSARNFVSLIVKGLLLFLLLIIKGNCCLSVIQLVSTYKI